MAGISSSQSVYINTPFFSLISSPPLLPLWFFLFMIYCQTERQMNVMVDYCRASLVLLRFLKHAVFLLSLVASWFLFPCYDAWWPNSSSPERDGKGTEARERHRAAARAVRTALGVATYGELVADQEAAAFCAVCLCRVGPRDRVRELRSCRHVFHRRCLDRWLDHDERLSCPLCRATLLDRRGASVQPPAQPSWAVERLLYLFGDDVLLADPHQS